tara:strand:- start:399 stop:572 length:174 start_codon:yes stop_codon:yes gene_type:complete
LWAGGLFVVFGLPNDNNSLPGIALFPLILMNIVKYYRGVGQKTVCLQKPGFLGLFFG